MNNKSYREVIGERLKEFRISRGLTIYRVAKKGNILINQVNAVESGKTNYTIDAFLGYIYGCDLTEYFNQFTDSLPKENKSNCNKLVNSKI